MHVTTDMTAAAAVYHDAVAAESAAVTAQPFDRVALHTAIDTLHAAERTIIDMAVATGSAKAYNLGPIGAAQWFLDDIAATMNLDTLA